MYIIINTKMQLFLTGEIAQGHSLSGNNWVLVTNKCQNISVAARKCEKKKARRVWKAHGNDNYVVPIARFSSDYL